MITQAPAPRRFQPNPALEHRYRKWLGQFDPRYTRSWEKTFRSLPQAAMCEATFWKILTDRGVTVQPNEDLTGATKAPDFLCTKDGSKFYVEVTCILSDTTARKTSLPAALPNRVLHPFDVWGFNKAVQAECQQKVRQCGNVNAPCLLAVGTFHSAASSCCVKKLLLSGLLTGNMSIGWAVNLRVPRNRSTIRQTATLRNAPFACAAGSSIQPRWMPISALLLGGFGVVPWRRFGIEHPAPTRAFDIGLLPDIEFCRLAAHRTDGLLRTEWRGGT
ncbi:MAG TPA: hypothetical protein VF306_09525 [Pirellulales bacterium]